MNKIKMDIGEELHELGIGVPSWIDAETVGLEIREFQEGNFDRLHCISTHKNAIDLMTTQGGFILRFLSDCDRDVSLNFSDSPEWGDVAARIIEDAVSIWVQQFEIVDE